MYSKSGPIQCVI